MENNFEAAAQKKLRFSSSIGELTAEQLFDLPLIARADRPDLDQVARTINSELVSMDEHSFVRVRPDPRKTELTLKLDIVKRVIEIKLDEKAKNEKAAENAERKRKLLAALQNREEKDLEGMTKEQIEAEIAKL